MIPCRWVNVINAARLTWLRLRVAGDHLYPGSHRVQITRAACPQGGPVHALLLSKLVCPCTSQAPHLPTPCR